MSAESIIALLAFLVPLAYSPGPGNAFFAALGAAHGMRAAIPALTGYHAATFAVTLVIGLGVGAAVLADPRITMTLSALGSLYVMWIAWSFIRSAHAGTGPDAATPTARVTAYSGAVVLLLNPKAYYIVTVMFTQFLQPSRVDSIGTVLLITSIFTMNNLAAFIVWGFAGKAITALFSCERAKRRIDYVFAAMLAGVAVWMAAPLLA